MTEIDETERESAEERLLAELDAGAESAEEGLYSTDEIREAFGIASR